MPTSTFDVNAAYAPIAARLKTVDGVRAVCGANDLAQVVNGKTTGTDGYVYLIFDGIAPKSDASNGRHQLITVTYSIIIASQNYQRDGMPDGVGKLIGGVMQAQFPIQGVTHGSTTATRRFHRRGYLVHPPP